MAKTSKKTIKKNEFDLNAYIVFVIIAVLPLVIRLAGVKLSGDELFFYSNEFFDDSFSYIKGIVFTFLVCFAFFNMGMNHVLKVNKIKIDKLFYLAIALVGVITLSYLMSDYKVTAWRGIMDRFEGYYVNVAYIVLFLVCANLLNVRKNLNLIIKGLLFSSVIISVIGILQSNGINILNSDFVKMLIVPNRLGAISQDLFKNANNYAYSTLGNPNYVGSYEAMVVPIAIGVLATKEEIKSKILYSIVLITNIAFLLYSQSEAGIAAVGFSTALMLGWLHTKNTQLSVILNIVGSFIVSASFVFLTTGLEIFQSKLPILVFLAFLLFGGLVSYINLGKSKKVKYVLSGLIILGVTGSLFIVNTKTFSAPKEVVMSELNFGKAIELELRIRNEPINMIFEKKEDVILPTNQEYVYKEVFDGDVSRYNFADENLVHFNYSVKESEHGLLIEFKKLKLRFVNVDGEFLIANSAGSLNVYHGKAEVVKLFKDESAGTARGYIWNHTLPLLKNNLIFGVGSDSFIFEFPQQTYENKFNQYNNPNLIVDKPHNIYLQWAANHGVLSVIILLIIVGNVLVRLNTKKLVNISSDSNNIYSYPLIASISGFMIAGIFNDSFVCVSIIFWALLGLSKNLGDELTMD